LVCYSVGYVCSLMFVVSLSLPIIVVRFYFNRYLVVV